MSKNLTIFEISQKMKDLIESSIDENGVVTDDFEAKSKELEKDKTKKLLSIAKYHENLSLEIQSREEIINNVTERQEKEISKLKTQQNGLMFLLGKNLGYEVDSKNKLSDLEISIHTTKSQTVDPAINVDELMQFNPFLVRVKESEIITSPDKKEIRKLLIAGEDVPGASLITKKVVKIT